MKGVDALVQGLMWSPASGNIRRKWALIMPEANLFGHLGLAVLTWKPAGASGTMSNSGKAVCAEFSQAQILLR